MFSQFISSLHAACEVVSLNAAHDYRRLLAAATPKQLQHVGTTYCFPLGPATTTAMTREWEAAVAAERAGAPTPVKLRVMFGRTLHLQRAAGGVLWVEFDDLCSQTLGPADFLAIAQASCSRS